MTVRAWLRWPALVAVGAALVLVALQGVLNADEPQTTWDFDGKDALNGWAWTDDTMALAAGEGVGDSQAAGITIKSPINTIERALVEVSYLLDVQPGASYELGGVYVSADGKIDWIRLGMRFYDEGGDLLTDAGSIDFFAPGPLHLEAAPDLCTAVEARLRIFARGVVDATIYLDNLFLKESAPTTACPTPVPSPTLTSTPSATPSPSLTPTATATTEPTSTPSQTSAATESATDQPATATNTPPSATATDLPPALLEFSNGGFEEGSDGQPSAWQTFGGLLMQTGTPARSGSWSGALFSSTESTKWAFQTVSVEPADWYQFQAFVYQDDLWVESAFLRISWYANDDGSGSSVGTIDSTDTLVAGVPDFRLLSTGPVMAPPGVHSAKVRVLMRPRDETSAVIYIDDVSFVSVAPPLPPASATAVSPTTPTPISLPTSTNTPDATPDSPPPTGTPRPADTATPIPAATAANTPTSTPEPTGIAATLANSGFESAAGRVLDSWQTFGGLLSQVDSPVRSGSAAGAFFSSSGSTKWVYQTIAVEPEAWYQLDAFVYQSHAFVEEALLRISWYASADGSGSALVSVDSNDTLASPAPGYRPLTTGPVQAPPGARSAKLRILMRPRDTTSALIYIDDVSFSRVAAPDVVPASPTPVAAAASSQVLSSFESAGPSVSNQRPATTNQRPSYTPMPVPVIRRHALRAPDQLATPREGDPLWPWALLGATAGAGAVGWGAYWALRRRSSRESLTQAG